MKTIYYFFIKIYCLIIFLSVTQLNLFSQIPVPFSDLEENKDVFFRLSYYDNMDSTEWRKSNDVKECRIAAYKYKGKEVSDKPFKEITYTFNIDGIIENIASEKGENSISSIFNSENKILKKVIYNDTDTLQKGYYLYDSIGRITKLIIVLKNDRPWYGIGSLGIEGIIPFTDLSFEYSYNEKNIITEFMIYTRTEHDYEFYKESHVYDETDRLVETKYCVRIHDIMAERTSRTFSNGQCSYKVEFFYNDKGKLTKTSYYYPDIAPFVGAITNNKPKFYYMWKLDDKDLVVEYQHYDKEWKLLKKTVNVCDTNKNLTQIINYDAAGAVTSTIMQTFNEKNKLKMKIGLNADNSTSYMYGYKYDEKGTKIEIIEFNTETRKPEKVYKLFYN